MGGVVRACYSGPQPVDKIESSLTFNMFHGNAQVKFVLGQDK
jgi:hypothetical protein